MRSRSILAAAVATTLWAAATAPVFATDNGTVDAQVTVATPCITVSPQSLDFGTLPFSTAAGTSTQAMPVEISNCGAGPEQLYGRGTDASLGGATVWSLVSDQTPCAAGVNTFNLIFLSSTPPNTYASTTDQLLETVGSGGVANNGAVSIAMPCVGSDGAAQTLSFQILFTATF